MALRTIRIGSLPGFQYDDADYDSAAETDQPMKAGTPVDATDVTRLMDIGLLYPLAVADIDNPTELASAIGSNGMMVLSYKAVGPAGLNEYTIYAYDSDGPALNSPYVVDAAGAGNERWIAIAGKYRIFTTMFTLTTKNPPIDADKAIYRDSTASDALVTSTWTQIKAFLKTYFDTIYAAINPAWTTPAYDAGDFTANGAMTWTVDAADVTTYAYLIEGKKMTVSIAIRQSTVGGVADTVLYVAIPASKTATKAMQNAAAFIVDNGAAAEAGGVIGVGSGATVIYFNRLNSVNWTLSANNTWVRGQITFEIN